MDIVEAIRSRRSIRGFKQEPVPKDVIREILEISSRSPSTMNTQPWEVTVIGGQVIEDIKRGNIEMLNSGATAKREAAFRTFEGEYRKRQVDLAIDIFKLMGITREDKEKRADWTKRGFRFFDAPAGIIITIDKTLSGAPLSYFDIGAITQSICLAALNYGLATCIEDQSVMFPEVIRNNAGISDSKQIVIAIAIGYPDWHFPANVLVSRREPVDKFVTWRGFD